MDTRIKLNNLGVIPPHYSEDGFFRIGVLPFLSVFPELPFPKNRIPQYFETKYYIEYLGFTSLQALILFNDYRIRKNSTGLINPFTLLIEAKNHLRKCSDADEDFLSRRPAREIEIGGGVGDDVSSGEFIWCEKFGLTTDIIQDIDTLLKNTKENKMEMDRYLDSFNGAKKVEDLLLIDFLIEIIDRRFTKLFTLERDARAFFGG